FLQGRDMLQHLKSGSANALAGLAGIPNFINKMAVTDTLETQKLLGVEGAEEIQNQLNAMPEDEKERFINSVSSPSSPFSGLGQASADLQNNLTDISEEISAKTMQYEGNIVDDIASGNLEQAAIRAANGFAESVPTLIMTAAPGGLV